MKIVVFGDVHGNLPALELMADVAGNVDQYVCLGDVVNYGPWSNECVQFIAEMENCIKIKGNHEDYFINGECDCNNYLANEFFNHCYSDFIEVSAIQNYEKESQFEDFICTHTLEDRYIFQDTDITLDKNFIIGHSHRQYKIGRNGYTLLNPGSVGQNRQYINEINYVLISFLQKSMAHDLLVIAVKSWKSKLVTLYFRIYNFISSIRSSASLRV